LEISRLKGLSIRTRFAPSCKKRLGSGINRCGLDLFQVVDILTGQAVILCAFDIQGDIFTVWRERFILLGYCYVDPRGVPNAFRIEDFNPRALIRVTTNTFKCIETGKI
jgi:hypothetical protein